MKSPLISPRITAITAPLGLLAIAAATLIPIYQGSFAYSTLSRWLYTIGAAVLLLSRVGFTASRAGAQSSSAWQHSSCGIPKARLAIGSHSLSPVLPYRFTPPLPSRQGSVKLKMGNNAVCLATKAHH